MARAAMVGGKLGEALVALQILTFEQLIDHLGRQARHKLVQALRWPQGAWRFDEGTHAVEGMQLRMLDVVFGGLRETAALDLSRLSRLDGLSFELTERGKRLRHELKKMLGERPFAALSAGAPIGEIERTHHRACRRAHDRRLAAAVRRDHREGRRASGSARRGSRRERARAGRSARTAGSTTCCSTRRRRSIRRPTSGAAPLDFMELSPEDSGVVSTAELAKVEYAARPARARRARRSPPSTHACKAPITTRSCSSIATRSSDDIDAAHQIKLALFDRTAASASDSRAQGRRGPCGVRRGARRAQRSAQARGLRPRARGRRARADASVDRHRADVSPGRGLHREGAVDPGDRPAEDRDRARAERS